MTLDEMVAEMAEYGLDPHDSTVRFQVITMTLEFVSTVAFRELKSMNLEYAQAMAHEWEQLDDGDPLHLQCVLNHTEDYVTWLAEWHAQVANIVERVTLLQQLAELDPKLPKEG